MLAYDFPLLALFWTMLIFFLWIIWFMLLFRVLDDILRSADLGGLAKTIWIIFVIFLPFLGVFVYVIARGRSMSQRSLDEAWFRHAAFDRYAPGTAGSRGSVDEIAKLASLRDQGVLSDAEFDAQKAQLLA
jgi:hypothetical protein